MKPRRSRADLLQVEEDFDEASETKGLYKPTTEKLLTTVRRYWRKYCRKTQRDPSQSLPNIEVKVLYGFFSWVITRRKSRIGSACSLQTYYNVFCLLREQEAGCKAFDRETKQKMQNIRHNLVKDYNLSTTKKKKPIMQAKDEFELLKTLYVSPGMRFDHERQRIQLALLVQLAGITGNRPTALTQIRYKEVKVSLLRDPDGGERPRRLVEIEFKHTKGFLGDKESNEIPLPDIPSEPCLLLCPHTHLLALLFLDRAFDLEDTFSPADLFRIRIPPGKNQQVIPIKPDLQDKPLFRRSTRSLYGSQISPDEPLAYNSLREGMVRLGMAAGMDMLTGPYTFRRGAGEAMDSSSHISEAQRNLILNHKSSAVFIHNYSSRYITGDLQAARRGLVPQTAILQAASGMSRTIDLGRPTVLSAEQRAGLNRVPEIMELHKQREKLKARIRGEYRTIARARKTSDHKEYDRVCRQHRNALSRAASAKLKEIRDTYNREQPRKDIESQLKGDNPTDDRSQRPLQYTLPERSQAIDALFVFAKPCDAKPDPLEGGARQGPESDCRRILAVQALISLGRLQEGRPLPTKKTDSDGVGDGDVHPPRQPPTEWPLECKPTQCIFCLGSESLAMPKRTHLFCTRGDLKKHFHRKHLRFLPDDESIDCPHPACMASLRDKQALRKHAEGVHKTDM